MAQPKTETGAPDRTGKTHEAPVTAKQTLSVTDNRTGKKYDIPIQNDTIHATDLRQIRVHDDDFGMMSYDPAFANTASCKSSITFIDGEKGILRYRGYPIEQLAETSTFLETAYLIIHGELPTKPQLAEWVEQITHHTFIHENIKKLMEGFRYDAHPMGMFVSTVAALSTFYPEARLVRDPVSRYRQIIRLIAKAPTLAAFGYRHNVGMPFAYPDKDLSYPGNGLNMMFSERPGKHAMYACRLHPRVRIVECPKEQWCRIVHSGLRIIPAEFIGTENLFSILADGDGSVLPDVHGEGGGVSLIIDLALFRGIMTAH